MVLTLMKWHICTFHLIRSSLNSVRACVCGRIDVWLNHDLVPVMTVPMNGTTTKSAKRRSFSCIQCSSNAINSNWNYHFWCGKLYNNDRNRFILAAFLWISKKNMKEWQIFEVTSVLIIFCNSQRKTAQRWCRPICNICVWKRIEWMATR